MTAATDRRPLRIGFIGSGFIAHFHLKALVGVRHVEVIGVFSPTPEKREAFARAVDELGLGACVAHPSLAALLADERLDAVWILTPNHTRLETMETIAAEVRAGRARLTAVACEKPLARTLGEARRMLALVEQAGLLHGYLENQLFSTAVVRGKEIIWRRAVPNSGRPYLARAAEEHSGPHEPRFWRGDQQGGGVLRAMMCHSVEVGRFLLTAPGAARTSLTLKAASATTATLKWAQPKYAAALRARMGARSITAAAGRGFRTRHPDLRRRERAGADGRGDHLVGLCRAGAAYRHRAARPRICDGVSTLNTGLKVFLSREVSGAQGEDLVEKQNAEQGLMPVLEDEAASMAIPTPTAIWSRRSRRARRWKRLPTAWRGRDADGALQIRRNGAGGRCRRRRSRRLCAGGGAPMRFPVLARLPIDLYLVALIATVVLAALLPARGAGAEMVGHATYGAVALLFFLYGARLAPQAILAGIMHWRLQGLVFLSTYLVFPIIGLMLVGIFRPGLGETLLRSGSCSSPCCPRRCNPRSPLPPSRAAMCRRRCARRRSRTSPASW